MPQLIISNLILEVADENEAISILDKIQSQFGKTANNIEANYQSDLTVSKTVK